jgi:hypothetical protein
LSHFEHNSRKSEETEGSDEPDNELIELWLREVELEYIPKLAIHVQKYYMRQQGTLYMTPLQLFVERLNDLNRFLFLFPKENPKQFNQDEFIVILD